MNQQPNNEPGQPPKDELMSTSEEDRRRQAHRRSCLLIVGVGCLTLTIVIAVMWWLITRR